MPDPAHPAGSLTGAEVRELARAAERADGVAPLSEAFLLSSDALGAGSSTSGPENGIHHAERRDGSGMLAGYGQVRPDGSAELVVHPAHRRSGHGGALLTELTAAGATRIWAHGTLPAAAAFATAHRLSAVRTLLVLARPLTAQDLAPVTVPPWVCVETYADRPDLGMLARLNAAAFAEHPEQGSLTVADLDARIAAPWFDPSGLLLLIDRGAPPQADPIAFHWTKADPDHPGEGEVYVVGVHPAYRGRGLARPLTRLGLAHLAARGLTEVILYVEADNGPALATYRGLGFAERETHTMYAVPS